MLNLKNQLSESLPELEKALDMIREFYMVEEKMKVAFATLKKENAKLIVEVGSFAT